MGDAMNKGKTCAKRGCYNHPAVKLIDGKYYCPKCGDKYDREKLRRNGS